jgi:hypothetical protein
MVNELDDFLASSDIIVANRWHDDLAAVWYYSNNVGVSEKY